MCRSPNSELHVKFRNRPELRVHSGSGPPGAQNGHCQNGGVLQKAAACTCLGRRPLAASATPHPWLLQSRGAKGSLQGRRPAFSGARMAQGPGLLGCRPGLPHGRKRGNAEGSAMAARTLRCMSGPARMDYVRRAACTVSTEPQAQVHAHARPYPAWQIASPGISVAAGLR